MLITRNTKVPLHWVFYAQLVFAMTIWAGFMTGAPFLLSMKKFIDNPAAITFLLSLDVFVTVFNGAFINWLSDRIWTRYGRRKILSGFSDVGKLCVMPLMPLAPDMWTLVALKWLYTILSDLGSPNQALTMEVIPSPQRGKGAGFFQMQLNIANLIFWGVVIGRFDDVYFMGPLAGIASLSGEHLMFFSSAFLFLAVGGYTFLGFKEIKPPNRLTVQEARRGDEWLLWSFVRSFFTDILGKDLLPLYLLLFVGAMASVGLGVLGPLLYIEQWGYTTQDMGTNVAIGAFINIFIALMAGWFADATSKMRVYVTALVVGLVLKFAWVAYVYAKPGHRPELWEILVFGEISAIFGLIAGTVSFPLILEYVERNRLGTAGAGMGIFNSLLRSVLTIFVGAWVVWWSVWFLPQAGDRLEIVLKKATDHEALERMLVQGGLGLDSIHLEAWHPPGMDAPVSRHWVVRRHTEESAGLQSEKKSIENDIAVWATSLQAPTGKDDRQRLEKSVADARARIAGITSRLESSAADFAGKVLSITRAEIPAEDEHIIEASDDGHRATLVLEVVEPVDAERAAQLAEGLHSPEFELEPDPAKPGEFRPRISVEPAGDGRHAIRVSVVRDARFTALARAMAEGGAPIATAQSKAALLTEFLREICGREPGAFTLSNARFQRASPHPSLAFQIEPGTANPEMPAPEALAAMLGEAPEISSAKVTRQSPGLDVRLEFQDTVPEAAPRENSATLARLARATGDDGFLLDSLASLHTSVIEAAAAKPVYLTAARPVVRQGFADRVYDYFFSVYALMITADFFGLAVISVIIVLERRGIVHRRGVEEDANR